MTTAQVICCFAVLFIFLMILALLKLIVVVFGFNECTLAQFIWGTVLV